MSPELNCLLIKDPLFWHPVLPYSLLVAGLMNLDPKTTFQIEWKFLSNLNSWVRQTEPYKTK